MREEHSLSAIRKATQTDSQGILECLGTAFEPYRDSYAPDAFADTVLTRDTLQQRLATMCIFVAVSDSGEIVGTIGCRVDRPGEGHIRGMAVFPAWQGSGVAAQLLSSVESELREKNCQAIRLDTTESLIQAIRFYEKNGDRKSTRLNSSH